MTLHGSRGNNPGLAAGSAGIIDPDSPGGVFCQRAAQAEGLIIRVCPDKEQSFLCFHYMLMAIIMMLNDNAHCASGSNNKTGAIKSSRICLVTAEKEVQDTSCRGVCFYRHGEERSDVAISPVTGGFLNP